jgi:antitoxin CcdA
MAQEPAKRAAEAARRPTNLTLSAALVQQARDLGVNLSKAAEAGIAEAVARAADANYAAENRTKMEAWSAFFEERGLPLADYRQF